MRSGAQGIESNLVGTGSVEVLAGAVAVKYPILFAMELRLKLNIIQIGGLNLLHLNWQFEIKELLQKSFISNYSVFFYSASISKTIESRRVKAQISCVGAIVH